MAGLDSLKKDSDIRQSIQLEMLTNKFKKSSNNLDSLDDLIFIFSTTYQKNRLLLKKIFGNVYLFQLKNYFLN